MINFNYLLDKLPGITVIMIDSGRNNEWAKEAHQSVLNQIYPFDKDGKVQIELKIGINHKLEYPIGAVWNELIRQAKYQHIFILDDDDTIVPMMLFNLMFYLQTLKLDKKNKNVIGVTPYITFMSMHEGRKYHKITHNYTSGLIEKEWLLKIPFREDIPKHIDMRWDDDILKQNKYVAVQPWNVGYMYRQHDKMVSGQNMHMRYADNDLNRIIDIEVPYIMEKEQWEKK